MKSFVTYLAVATAFLGFGANAIAATAEADVVRCPPQMFGGSSDGICYSAESQEPSFYLNGEPAQLDNVKTVGEDFNYGDGLGIVCNSVFQFAYSKTSTDNTACSSQCGNSFCVIGVDGTDFTTCADTTADGCLCQTAPLDLFSVGCGTDWEMPALGITMITTARGFKLGHVALLQQDIGPDMDAAADGLDIAGDQTGNDGNEIFTGMYGASGAPMTPGVDPAFQLCVTFEVDDITLVDDLWIGWRSFEAPQAAVNSYNTYAAVGLLSNDGDWYGAIEDDGGTEDEDDLAFTTLADDTQVTACTRIDDNRYVSFSVDGVVIADPDAAQMDSGEPLVPFMTFLMAGAPSTQEIFVQRWEVSYWDDGI